ncbi:hypothetical protein AAHU30_27005 (plasmid) [Klebsiella variicola subsp. variicola]|uniref:hypothetical protein n=1 Tax=Klebsiella variicola TaxID=244366 RepID=UPI0035A2438C
MTITPRHSDITALLTATFMVRIFLKRFSSLLTIKVRKAVQAQFRSVQALHAKRFAYYG